jgi:hypothetical protein
VGVGGARADGSGRVRARRGAGGPSSIAAAAAAAAAAASVGGSSLVVGIVGVVACLACRVVAGGRVFGLSLCVCVSQSRCARLHSSSSSSMVVVVVVLVVVAVYRMLCASRRWAGSLFLGLDDLFFFPQSPQSPGRVARSLRLSLSRREPSPWMTSDWGECLSKVESAGMCVALLCVCLGELVCCCCCCCGMLLCARVAVVVVVGCGVGRCAR